jgi:hypothetical protein
MPLHRMKRRRTRAAGLSAEEKREADCVPALPPIRFRRRTAWHGGAVAQDHATYTTPPRTPSAANVPASAPRAAAAPPPGRSGGAQQPRADPNAADLDRIEVTGSRIGNGHRLVPDSVATTRLPPPSGSNASAPPR